MNNITKLLLGILLFFSTLAVNAEQRLPAYYLPNTSDPAIAAFVEWQTALLANDFTTYKRLSFSVPSMTDEIQRKLFDVQRESAPSSFKISEKKINSNGSVSFHAVGCKDNRRQVNIVTVGNKNGLWLVAASGWGPPWGNTVNLCPI